MWFAIGELVVYAVERLAIALMLIFAVICLAAGRCHGQVVVGGEPTLAPHDCYCGVSCPCLVCECNVKAKSKAVSVRKPAKTTPGKASIKLSVTRNGVASVASGTVVDSKDNKSTVLTCWHLFREPGELKVHLGDKTVNGRLVRSNSKLDLAVVEFDGSHDYAPFSPKESLKGQAVTAYGYEHSGDLKAFNTRIIGYYNYPDARVEGRAAPGRSGGGLFNGNGELVGVCSAADQPLNESIYISYPAVELFLTGKSTVRADSASPAQNCPDGQCKLRQVK